MARQSILLLSSTAGELNVTGTSVPSAGYYGSGNNLQTIAVYLVNFTGRLYIEGTLASADCIEDSDWFQVNYANGTTNYVEFPQNPMFPTGTTGDTGVLTWSYRGNFTFVRAVVDRTYQSQTDPYMLGSIDQILLNY